MTEILRKDSVNEAFITFLRQKARVKCDRKCKNAWGLSQRPKIWLSDDDEDDWCYLADTELEQAPEDPGTTEGDDSKPQSPDEFPTRWCVRECERCAMTAPGEWAVTPPLRNFNDRVCNKR